MSDIPTSTPKSDAPSPDPKEPAKKPLLKPARTRGQRWRRRFIVAALTLLLCIAIFRVVLVIALPSVMRTVLKHYGLTASYERTEIYLVDGDVGLWHLKVSPLEGGEPIAQTEYCRADISTWDLL